MQGNRIIGIIAAVVAAGTFGMIPLFSIPLMQAGMTETSVLFYRCLFSSVAVGGMCLAGRKSIAVSGGTVMRLGGMSFLYCCTAVALLMSYRYLSSGVVTTIHFLYPVVVALLMAWLYKEKCSIRLMIAAGVTLIGVASLSWSGGGFMSGRGIVLALSTALSYALYIVGLNQKGLKDMDSRVVMFYILVFCTIVFGFISLSGGGISPIVGGRSWLNLIMLALLPTIVSNVALIKAVKYAGPTTTSILGSAEPMVAVIFGVSVFSETLTLNGIVGLVVIVAAVTYVILSQRGKNYACH